MSESTIRKTNAGTISVYVSSLLVKWREFDYFVTVHCCLKDLIICSTICDIIEIIKVFFFVLGGREKNVQF